MSVTLNFKVCHQNITRADSCNLVADSLNYAYAHFDFCSSDWDGLIKTAVFTRGQDTYEQILEDDQCLIPWEVLPDGKGIFTVSVFAGNRITTNVVKVKLDASGWSFALESSQPPTEGVYSQILTRLADVEDTVVESAESAAQSATSAAESAQSAEQSMEAAQTAKTAAEEAAASVTQYSKTAESWAVGGTGTRTGEDTDNSKYYAEQAGAASQTAVSASNTATGAAQAATQAAGSASQSAQTAAEGAQIVQELYNGAVSDITAAKTAAVGAIQTKGDQVLDSIPEDYTELSGDVTALKADLSDKADQTDMLKAFPTDTASGSVASFVDGANVPVKSLIVNIDPVQSGSGDPSPTNIRPISGWTEVNVQRTGKNLFDEANATIYKRYFQAVTDGYKWSPISDSSSYVLKCLPNTTYTLKPNNPDVNIFRVATINVGIEESENTTLNQVSIMGIPRTITTDADATYIVIQINNAIASAKATQLQIELGESATEFEPYQSISVTIPLGQTVYGGKLDVTNGELVIDMEMVNLGTLGWSYYQNGIFYTTDLETVAKIEGRCVSDIYVNRSFSISNPINGYMYMSPNGNKSVFRAVNSAYSNVTAFKTAMNGHQLCYELATPLTIQLDPHEVTALFGSNNVWADTGDSTVEYRADTKLYIEKLTAPTEDDMIADHAITANTFFMVGNQLYRATTAIASGATITVGTNATKLSLSDALNALV